MNGSVGDSIKQLSDFLNTKVGVDYAYSDSENIKFAENMEYESSK